MRTASKDPGETTYEEETSTYVSGGDSSTQSPEETYDDRNGK